MAKAFSRKGSHLVAELEDGERWVVVMLLQQSRALLAPEPTPLTGDPLEDLVGSIGGEATGEAPRDPVMARLLPVGHRGDDEIATEYRRLTEHGLREHKTANLDTAIDALTAADGPRLSLTRDEGGALLVALADTRLMLGGWLELRTDEDADDLNRELYAAETAQPDQVPGEPEPTPEPRLVLAAYYDFLTWLQESLIHALSR